ncbi:hypothetical protein [Aquimarina litoralis]|uniref:hypothetical protein n=1 Tax=Aquimarina litoralis TaxID=584605 RepID=UPI001C59258C|nr:hypothetical protein [Aquimarina litoralis]MBW1296793.1 hypothetical protein [Aquimarina litoralis]
MNKTKLKKICQVVLVLIGTILLIVELGSSTKNYYIQTIGIICLMTGLFIINTGVSSRFDKRDVSVPETSEEEE